MPGWQEYALVRGPELRTIDPGAAPISPALGVLGMSGLTAFVGLLDLCSPARASSRGGEEKRRDAEGNRASSRTGPARVDPVVLRARRGDAVTPDGIFCPTPPRSEEGDGDGSNATEFRKGTDMTTRKTTEDVATPKEAPQKTEHLAGRRALPPVEHARVLLGGVRHGAPAPDSASTTDGGRDASSAPPRRSGAARTRAERNAAARRAK